MRLRDSLSYDKSKIDAPAPGCYAIGEARHLTGTSRPGSEGSSF